MATRFTFALISLDVLSHALFFMFILLEQTDVYKMYFVYSFSINITVTCVMHFYAGKLTNCFAVQLLPIHVIVWRPGVLHVIIITDCFIACFWITAIYDCTHACSL